ncbi:MAG: hypothetical protein ACOY33_12730 [Pseudomonadota bacterium]
MAGCQPVSLQQLTLLIDRLRNAPLTPAERAEHERFFRKCIPGDDALAFVRAPEQHPANPRPGTVPTPEELARIVLTLT